MSASKQLGIDFSVQHVKDLLQAFVDARRESHATAQSLVADARMVTQATKALQTATGKAALVNAKVSANPSQNVSSNVSGSHMMIDIRLAPIAVVLKGQGGTNLLQSGGSRGLTVSAQRFPMGPRQRLAALQNMLPVAAAQGNQAALADMLEQSTRLQRRMRPKSTSDKLWEVATTSRFAAGGASPLVGKTLDAFGGRNTPLAKGLFGVTILGTAAMEGAKAIFKMTDEAKQFTLSQVQMQSSLGGTAKESAHLKGIGIAAGLSAEDMAGLAKNLQSSQSSPFGMMYAAQAGVFNLQGPLGNQDLAGQEIKYVNWLRDKYQKDKSPGKSDSLRSVRALGQEALLPAMKLSQPDWHQFVKAGQDTEQSPAKMLQAIKLQATEQELQTSWQKLLASLTGNDGVINALKSFADTLNSTSSWIDRINKPGDTSRSGSAVRSLMDPHRATPFPLLNGASAIYHWMHPDRDLGAAKAGKVPFALATPAAQAAYERSLHHRMLLSTKQQSEHLEKVNSQMIKSHTGQMQKDLMKIMMPGSYGRVTRDGAMPRALDTGFVLNRYLAAKALQLSSF